MFKKLVAIEPISLIPSAEERLHDFAHEVNFTMTFPPTAMR